jgi:hypothetical protein
MVLGNLLNRARANAVNPAVSHMRDVCLIPSHCENRARGPHAAKLGIALSIFNDMLIDRFDTACQCICWRTNPNSISESLSNSLRCYRTRLPSARMAAHPVAHNQQSPNIITRSKETGYILVLFPNSSPIASLADEHSG